ncbi:MAG: hypothetical protein JSS50_00580 [Proteobacteria bacterium]|nr:hypothetical protein [Pseudomonadota bacterium]
MRRSASDIEIEAIAKRAVIAKVLPDAQSIIANAKASEGVIAAGNTPRPGSGGDRNIDHPKQIRDLYRAAFVELCLLEEVEPTSEVAPCFFAAREMYNSCKTDKSGVHPLLQAYNVNQLDKFDDQPFIAWVIRDDCTGIRGGVRIQFEYCLSEYKKYSHKQENINNLADVVDTAARIALGELAVLDPAKRYDNNSDNQVIMWFLRDMQNDSSWMDNKESRRPIFLTQLQNGFPETYARVQQVLVAHKQRIQALAKKHQVSGRIAGGQHMAQVHQRMYGIASKSIPLTATASPSVKLDRAVKESVAITVEQCLPNGTREERTLLQTSLVQALKHELDYSYDARISNNPQTPVRHDFGLWFRQRLSEIGIKVERILQQDYCAKIVSDYTEAVKRQVHLKDSEDNDINSITNTIEALGSRPESSLKLAILRDRAICKALREYVKQGGKLADIKSDSNAVSSKDSGLPGVVADHNNPALKELEKLVRRRELALDTLECFNAEGKFTAVTLGEGLAIGVISLIMGGAAGAIAFGAFISIVGVGTLIAQINTDFYQDAFDAFSELFKGNSKAFIDQLQAGNPIVIIAILACLAGFTGLVATIVKGVETASERGGRGSYKEVLNQTLPPVLEAYIMPPLPGMTKL